MMFRVGQKVVCIKAGFDGWLIAFMYFINPTKSGLPSVGKVYTVSNVYSHDEMTFIELLEHPAPAERGWLAGFNANCFRPIVEKKTDISIFTEILNNVPLHEKENV